MAMWLSWLLTDILPGGSGGGEGKEGKEGPAGKEGPEGKEGKEGKQGPEGKAPVAEWINVEAVNAKLEQTVPIQCAVILGMVFLRGFAKVITAELPTKSIYFTLPPAARPAVARNVMLNNNQGSTTQTLIAKPNGECEVLGANTVNKTPCFDGMNFSL